MTVTSRGGDHAASPPSGTRERIQAVALRLFSEQGYESTSMRQIAEELGFTKAALYYHFKSKEDIVRALLETMRSEVADLVMWAGSQEPGPDLRRQVIARWTAIMQHQGLRMFRFLSSNYRLVRDIRSDSGQREGMAAAMGRLFAVLTPPNASVEDRLRARFALLVINMTGMASRDIEADEDEILAATARISASLLPPEF
ncbi:TetR/AcrR family transcriptional regulator [Sinomonas terrae]|uniref:TetR/AcrR family transcriptional regulator n=1 Tax=Sinomonas terrae TaxID=2908838 RepID=A0ABS9U173_9MICC|nr:TetR/AcrR family transcriptional regulator [Sinomonas terrae]MCH6470351.1 TetR/AcrR family transcriptional regulator [Sinomonas terrae]